MALGSRFLCVSLFSHKEKGVVIGLQVRQMTSALLETKIDSQEKSMHIKCTFPRHRSPPEEMKTERRGETCMPLCSVEQRGIVGN